MHSMENLRKPEHMTAVKTLQSKLHSVRGRRASSERMIKPWASTSVDFGMNTVRLAPKPAGRAAPYKVNHPAQEQIHAWMHEVLRIRQTQYSKPNQEAQVEQKQASS